MDENKIAESTNSDALLHLRANRVLLARRINEIAFKIIDLRTELETLDQDELERLDQEMKAKARQLEEVEQGIRALSVDKLSARHAGNTQSAAEANGDEP
jgi:hypothetical protein